MSGKYNQANKSFSLALQLGHNSTVAIAADGRILGILSQEKMRQHKEFLIFSSARNFSSFRGIEDKTG